MGVPKVITMKGKAYYYYGSYTDDKEVQELKRYYKKKLNARYFVLKSNVGFILPEERYHLYFDKVGKLTAW